MYNKLTNRVRALKSTSGLLNIDDTHMINGTRPSPSVFAYCKQSKTGMWETWEQSYEVPIEALTNITGSLVIIAIATEMLIHLRPN